MPESRLTHTHLQSIDRVNISNRCVWMFAGIAGVNPRNFIGEEIYIDGELVRVTGVETYALIDPTGQSFGLCVEPIHA